MNLYSIVVTDTGRDPGGPSTRDRIVVILSTREALSQIATLAEQVRVADTAGEDHVQTALFGDLVDEGIMIRTGMGPPGYVGPVPPECTKGMRDAFALLMDMSEAQRGRVMCWFCRCGKHIEPGKGSCSCGGFP